MKESGLTLLELLVVIAVLAVLAGGVVLVLDSVEEDAAVKLAKTEMLRIKEALLRFRQDTGYLPKQGPFALVTDAPAGQVPVPTQGAGWFHSPANFVQLYEEPMDGSVSPKPIRPWNRDTGRGWNGPYLTRQGEGLVDLGDGLSRSGSGSPLTGTVVLSEVRAVADPFTAGPEGTIIGTVFVWRSSPGSAPHSRWGRPYFVFDLDDPGPAESAKEARLVGLGPDGRYDCDRDGDADCDAADNNGTVYDLCSPPSGSDDLILCLFK